MARDHAGRADDGKDQHNTGIPNNIDPNKMDQDVTEKYTHDDQEIADHLRTNNPNRNVDKNDATKAGGYRN